MSIMHMDHISFLRPSAYYNSSKGKWLMDKKMIMCSFFTKKIRIFAALNEIIWSQYIFEIAKSVK